MAHPVAHEGNPRTNSITISTGEVLSTATLEVEIPEPVGGTPLEETPTPNGGSSTCNDVFAWNEERGDNLFTWPNVIRTAANSPGEFRQFWDNSQAVTISPSPSCYGVLYTELAKPTDWPTPPYIEVSFNSSFLGLIEGAPRAGVCIFIQNEKNDPNNITVVGLVTDWAEGNTGLYYWRNGSLANFDDATVADFQNVVPSVGNAYRIFRVQSESFGSFIGAQIRETANGSVLYDFNVTGIFVPQNEHITTVGYIAVGSGLSGTVLFGGNGSTDVNNIGLNVTVYGDTGLKEL